MYCLWPLPHLLLVCTALVCVLFVATPMSTIPLLAIDPVRINKKIFDRNEHERIL